MRQPPCKSPGGGKAEDRPHQAMSTGIPITYVPARNTIFLSFALAWAELLGAGHIFIGANAIDYSGYPDCRPEFIALFETLANTGTKAGVEGARFRIHAPLLTHSKAAIIRKARELAKQAVDSAIRADNKESGAIWQAIAG